MSKSPKDSTPCTEKCKMCMVIARDRDRSRAHFTEYVSYGFMLLKFNKFISVNSNLSPLDLCTL